MKLESYWLDIAPAFMAESQGHALRVRSWSWSVAALAAWPRALSRTRQAHSGKHATAPSIPSNVWCARKPSDRAGRIGE